MTGGSFSAAPARPPRRRHGRRAESAPDAARLSGESRGQEPGPAEIEPSGQRPIDAGHCRRPSIAGLRLASKRRVSHTA